MSLWGRAKTLLLLRYNIKVARLRAEEQLAAYQVKSRMEWDLKWVRHALDHTWKDEFLILLWCGLTLGFFIPGLREYVSAGFEAMRAIHPDAPAIFMFGWAIIFAATFGIKSALGFLYPNRAANLVQTMGNVRDDVPADVVKAANDAAATSTPTDGETRNERVY